MPTTFEDPKTSPGAKAEAGKTPASATAPAAPGSAASADEEARRAQARHKKAMSGTGVLPTPDDAPTVAGMPRKGRSLADPGEPGVITPADDVYGNDPTDLSQSR